MSQIPRSHLAAMALAGLAMYGFAILAFYPVSCSSQEREAGNFSSSVLDDSSTPNPASPSSPIPTALVDPALTTPTRAQLGEPAPPADSPSSFPSIAEGQVSLSDLEGDLGDWWRTHVKEHPNGVWKKIPKDARHDQVVSFAITAKAITAECDALNLAIAHEYDGDFLGYSKDPRVRQNDRDRQQKLKNALNSIWPGSME